MENEWTLAKINSLTENGVEESQILEYKASGALSKTDGKKTEITKDVSAMANAAGGTIIYGIQEFDESRKKHLPEKITPVNRFEYSKEWLEQIINNIQPRIQGIQIFPIDINIKSEDVVYVVVIPQSNTAHQAKDFRYYKRFNFEATPMNDYEVRDVMHRSQLPNAEVNFSFRTLTKSAAKHEYRLIIIVRNIGTKVINHFKLEFTFPKLIQKTGYAIDTKNMSLKENSDGNLVITYHSLNVLFPNDEVDINDDIALGYIFDQSTFWNLNQAKENNSRISWTLFADDMPKKQGVKKLSELNNF
jgi:hypothetical protein